jgi:hypothetical protein
MKKYVSVNGVKSKFLKENRMIIYGLTMQEKPEAVPKEVAEWLRDSIARYPNIDFEIDVHEISAGGKAEYEAAIQKYVRAYDYAQKGGFGVTTVTFLYAPESWTVRIVGGKDKDGNIISRDANAETHPLGAKLRAEIAGISNGSGLLPALVPLSDETVAMPRNGEPILERPEMIPFSSDGRMTSEVSMSGGEFADLLNDPTTKEEAMRAIWAKDWPTIRRLRDQKQ